MIADGKILVPVEAISATHQDDFDSWASVDWMLAAFLLLEGWHERLWEYQYGPVHSQSLRLSGWDQRAWRHAWVDRIGLFLRQWAIQRNGPAAEQQLGFLPSAEIRMTQDADALMRFASSMD